MDRREFLQALSLCSVAVTSPLLAACQNPQGTDALLGPDKNGIKLPPGCTSRIIAQTGLPVGDSKYHWHGAPDGGGIVETEDGGWIYLSNSELPRGGGGVSAIRFDRDANIVDAYSIQKGSNRNCGGVATPWDTWLSGEEVSKGRVWECDPYGKREPVVHNLLGSFSHEFLTYDPREMTFYLTEDTKDGCFYRFVPENPALRSGEIFSRGVLQVAEILNGSRVNWHTLNDPTASETPTRKQIAQATPFNGGEGICYFKGDIYFDTKGDDRVWRYQPRTQELSLFYDAKTSPTPILTGVDTLHATRQGILVAEDGGDMQIVFITELGELRPVLQLVGQDGSEITGIAAHPTKPLLYFSSQRGTTGKSSGGITYEISGTLVT